MDAKQVGTLFSLAMNLPKESPINLAVDGLVAALKADLKSGGAVSVALVALFDAVSNPRDPAYSKSNVLERAAITSLASGARRWLQRR